MFHIGYECIINRNHPLSSKQLQPFTSICQGLCEHCNQSREKPFFSFVSFMYGFIDTRSSSLYLAMGTIEAALMYLDLSILKTKEQQSQASLVTGPCVTYNQI